MSCDIFQKASEQNVVSGDTNVNAKYIRELAQQIRSTTDCNSLKYLVIDHTRSLKDLTQSVLGESLEILDKILPILQLPGANPFKIVKYLGKMVVGLALPQLEAYIRYTEQLIELADAITELAMVTQEVLPHLRSCAIEIVDEAVTSVENEINTSIFRLLENINLSIQQSICSTFSEPEIGTAIDSIISTELLLDSIQILNNTLSGEITTGLNKISQTQTLITNLTGGVPSIVTTDPIAFSLSLGAGALTSLKDDTTSYLEQAAPVNTVAPVVSGTTQQGSVLSVTQGTWTPTTGVTFAYQWYRGTSPIEGATSNQYTLTASDVGNTIKCEVLAENSSYDSPTSQFSNITSTITTPYTPPTNTVSPQITGTLNVGQTLTCSQGTWTGSTPITYTYQWQWAHVALNIAGANTSTYVVSSQDLNRTLRCVVTATNIANTTSANSNIVTIT